MEKIPLLLLFMGHIWVDASQNILPVVAPKLKALFSLSYLQVGLLMMVLNLTSSVIQPLFGFISDYKRMGWMVPVGLLWTTIAMGLLGWSSSFFYALLLVGFSGLGTAAFHPRAMVAVHHVSGSRLGFGTAIFSTGGNIGFAIGPLVGSFLVLGYGLHATPGVVIPGLMLFLLLFFYPGDFLNQHGGRSPGKQKALEGNPASMPWISLIALCVIVTLRSWVHLSLMTYFPLFFELRGIDLRTASLLLMAFLVSGAAAGLYGGHLSDRIGRRSVVVVSLLLFTPVTAAMIWSRGWMLWVWIVASGVSLVASFSVTVVMAQELLPRNLGLASGLILGLAFGTGGLGTALSGYLADGLGLDRVFWILALVPLLCPPLTALIKTHPRQLQND